MALPLEAGGSLPDPGFALDRDECRARAGFSWGRSRTEKADGILSGLASGCGAFESGAAVLAQGGYGRAELAPYSDLDILILIDEGRKVAELEPFITGLWDLGVKVGHAVRTPREAILQIKNDLASATAAVDLRPIAGDAGFIAEALPGLETALDGEKRREFAEVLIESRNRRISREGYSFGYQEMRLKDGAGGLRDSHFISWIRRFLGDELDEPAPEERRANEEAKGLLMAFRWSLQTEEGRESDRLVFEIQDAVTRNLGYEDPFEGMRSLCRAMHVINFIAADISKKALYRSPPRKRESPARTSAPGLAERWEAWRRTFGKKTAGFDEGIRSSVGVTFDPPERIPERIRTSFREIIGGRDAGAALSSMARAGLLGEIIPGWNRIRGLVRRDPLHSFTVDQHTLAAVREWQKMMRSSRRRLNDTERKAMREILRPDLLVLALLLHDIGKGMGQDHIVTGVALIGRIMNLLGYNEKETELVSFLVREHLVLAEAALRRDIDDPSITRKLAEKTGSVERLSYLYLLTICDMKGLGPEGYNDWKAGLLGTLFLRVARQCERRLPGPALAEETMERRIKAVRRLLDGTSAMDLVDEHFSLVTPRYAQAFTPAQIAHHLRLLKRFADGEVALGRRYDPVWKTSELVVITRERRGIFAALAGTIAASGFGILSAQIHTRMDGFAFDAFNLVPPGGGEGDEWAWRRCEDNIRSVVKGSEGVEALVSKKEKYESSTENPRREEIKVVVDQESSASHTVLEISAPDDFGLLYRIARAIHRCGMDVTSAIVSTERNTALDVFYITDAGGRKIGETAMLRAIKAEIVSSILEGR